MGKTYGEYLKEMRAGMPDKIRVDFSQPITPEVLGREFGDAWKERYGREIVNWAATLNTHRKEFQRVADTVSRAVMPTLNSLRESGVFETVARTGAAMAEVAKEAVERQEMMKSLVAPLAHDYLPSRSAWPHLGTHQVDREAEMDALAERVAEKLWAKMMSGQTIGPRRGATAAIVRPGTIESITLVRPNDGDRYTVVINDIYDETLTVDRRQKAWDILFRVAEEERIEYASAKSHVDYLTTNRQCKLYTATGYPLRKILICSGGIVKPGIPMKIISEKASKQRLARAIAAKVTT